jgi:hypothetical protein
MKRIAIVKNNVVVNVIIIEDGVALPAIDPDTLYIENGWVGIGDWWEESEGRFYRPMPNDNESESNG